MWHDRLTGRQHAHLPQRIDHGRYSIEASPLTLNGHTPNFFGLLVSDGGANCRLDDTLHNFIQPPPGHEEETRLLEEAITTIGAAVDDDISVLSPLMPAAIVDNQSLLLPFERALLEVIQKGHLQHISQRPRLDLRYDDEVADVARVRRLAKGALVHLASHSECWQRQTLGGVVPKQILAQFSEDDFNIYENRVYARLLDKIERHLYHRLRTLRNLQSTLAQALDFYQSQEVNYRLRNAICQLWGMTYDEDATDGASRQLNATLATLEQIFRIISGLRQSGLYLRVSRTAQVTGGVHMTNILSHDPHYGHLPLLWAQLADGAQPENLPQQRLRVNQSLAAAYSSYAGLVLRHALQPWLHGKSEGSWAGRTLRLRQQGMEWLLSCDSNDSASEETLLSLVPFLNHQQVAVDLPENRYIAWPCVGHLQQALPDKEGWIRLSPLDMYCVERFGLLIDKILSRELLRNFARPVIRIPRCVLPLATKLSSLTVDQQLNQITLHGDLTKAELEQLTSHLINNNASTQAEEITLRYREWRALQQCPVCDHTTELVYQYPGGFKTLCKNCNTARYFSQHENAHFFEQTRTVERESKTFLAQGRRVFNFQF